MKARLVNRNWEFVGAVTFNELPIGEAPDMVTWNGRTFLRAGDKAGVPMYREGSSLYTTSLDTENEEE